LIYFKGEAQERALRALQYAVRPEGYLFLGSSESLSSSADGLRVLNTRHKIFQKIGATSPLLMGRNTPTAGGRTPGVRGGTMRQPPDAVATGLMEASQAQLLNRFAPPAILVNPSHEAVHIFGDAGQFIQVRPGSATLELNRLLPESLVPVASALLYKAARDQTDMVSDLVRLPAAADSEVFLRLSVHPVDFPADDRYCLLCFHQQELTPAERPQPLDVGEETMARIAILERELLATRENLQATIEELETANEELQATNEELMASNEELQSSNEELQSVNEELNTVNVEYQEKMLILNRINADLDSMAKAAGVATVFVDQDLALTRFSPDAADVFRLRDSDIGRRLDDLAHSLRYPDLISDIESTLRIERMIEREIQTLDGKRTYLVRILPYQVPSTPVRGAVATFVDLTAFHDLRRLQVILDTLNEHIAVLDVDGTIMMVNAAWARFARANGDPDMRRSGPGANYLQACATDGGQSDAETASAAVSGLRSVLEGSRPSFSLEYPCHSQTELRWFVMTATRIVGQDLGAVVSHVDVTDLHRRGPRNG
jgi:two-component system CheB/CheR fusion protein